MSSRSSMHRISTATWMNLAASRIRPNIFAVSSSTTSMNNKNSFNTIPDSKANGDRLSHHQKNCLSTTRLHPTLSFLSSMSALDPRPFNNTTRPSTLNGVTKTMKTSIIKNSESLPPFTTVMVHYKTLPTAQTPLVFDNGEHNDKESIKKDDSGIDREAIVEEEEHNDEEQCEENMDEDKREKLD
ncbi:hypothetical protein B0T20DRAFT_481790 [Sordaria brevicollis]|uniref:Uncharacterized protein n=1 Tax=Sordaria brevicollis TaxID=83679 RepID=A0AAE0P8M4_SORBR|nr:hypothetical protein B0T20DRAFT_481790 [Sordaria brevicollis]